MTQVSAKTGDPRQALVDAYEEMYHLDRTPADWLERVTRVVRPLLDHGRLGVIANLYRCPDPCDYKAGRAVVLDCPSSIMREYFNYVQTPAPLFIADTVLSRSEWMLHDLPRWCDVAERFQSRRDGIVDKITINAVERDGEGVSLGSFLTERRALDKQQRAVLRKLARHLAAAHRLMCRRRARGMALGPRDALLAPDGKVQHVGQAFGGREHLATLARAARAIDKTRAERERHSKHLSDDAWVPFIDGRWTLVDWFERNGRRFVLAAENLPQAPSVLLLSARERDVVRCALRGLHNKAIAYELGLADSTVRVLIARACSKVGVSSRRHLLAAAGVTLSQVATNGGG